MPLINAIKAEYLTDNKSKPHSSKLGMRSPNSCGLNLGNSELQYLSLLAPGHVSSFGVPNTLKGRTSYFDIDQKDNRITIITLMGLEKY